MFMPNGYFDLLFLLTRGSYYHPPHQPRAAWAPSLTPNKYSNTWVQLSKYCITKCPIEVSDCSEVVINLKCIEGGGRGSNGTRCTYHLIQCFPNRIGCSLELLYLPLLHKIHMKILSRTEMVRGTILRKCGCDCVAPSLKYSCRYICVFITKSNICYTGIRWLSSFVLQSTTNVVFGQLYKPQWNNNYSRLGGRKTRMWFSGRIIMRCANRWSS